MFERNETSAVCFYDRLNPVELASSDRCMRKVTAISGSFEPGGSSMIVYDVQGPIVTGVLGGDDGHK